MAVIFQWADQGGAMMNDVGAGLVGAGLVGAGLVGAGLVGTGFVGTGLVETDFVELILWERNLLRDRVAARPIAR